MADVLALVKFGLKQRFVIFVLGRPKRELGRLLHQLKSAMCGLGRS